MRLLRFSAFRGLLLASAVALVSIEARSRVEDREILPQGTSSSLFSSVSNLVSSLSSTGHARHLSTNATELIHKRRSKRGLSKEQLAKENEARYQRTQERRANARRKLQSMPPPDPTELQRLSHEQLQDAKENHPMIRRMGWLSGGNYQAYGEESFLAAAGEEYDKWAQAYRMLGGYIDCDHSKDDDGHSGDSGDQNNGGDGDGSCSRWMLWAAYVNEDYQGNEYDEYFGDEPTSYLDCHSPSPTTNWKLLGVYRQEFYQYIEQISKHLWAIDDYDYIVALAGLSYMTDADCFATGSYDGNGNAIYTGVAPQEYGGFQMALYTDSTCIYPADNSLGMTLDDFGWTTDIDLGSKDESHGDDDGAYSDEEGTWYDTQEYTLTQLNEVYDSFRYCTACMDYPTYQDGYFIGDDGTDDDDLINQCWKFWSHDSFYCGADCLAKAHSQGTILGVEYNGYVFGKTPNAFYTYRKTGDDAPASSGNESQWSRLAGNVILTFSFLVFVATFLAFAVARRSRQRERRSGKSRRLLDEAQRNGSSRPRSRSRAEGDGVFRSKSTDRKKSSGSTRTKSKSRSGSSSRRARESGYEPPRSSSRARGSSSRKSSRSRRREDDR